MKLLKKTKSKLKIWLEKGLDPIAKVFLPEHIWRENKAKQGAVKVDLKSGSLRHSNNDLRGASSVIIMIVELSRTTPEI